MGSGMGAGQFRPMAGANPAIGSVGTLERVEEHRVEVLVVDESGGKNEQIKGAVAELKKVGNTLFFCLWLGRRGDPS